jgi:hypothetical protein
MFESEGNLFIVEKEKETERKRFYGERNQCPGEKEKLYYESNPSATEKKTFQDERIKSEPKSKIETIKQKILDIEGDTDLAFKLLVSLEDELGKQY